MPPQLPPEDEREWEDINVLQGLPGNSLNSDSVIWYFMNSPFYDPNCNNQALMQQLFSSPDGQAIMSDRHAVEERLRVGFQAGRQFVVVAEPRAEGEPWVIQKQNKVLDPVTGRTGRIDVEATYYTLGAKILMAPSLLDIVQTRLLAVTNHLQGILELAKDMSYFSPSTGYTYLPPSYDLPKSGSVTSRLGSRAGSPTPSVTEPAISGSQSQAIAQPTSDPTTTFSDRLFMHSLELTESYFNEYMDENPLQGEPGSFVLTNTHAAILSRHEAEEKRRQQQQQATAAAAAAAAAASASQASSTVVKPESQTQSTLPSATSTPKPGTPAHIYEPSVSRKASIASLPKPGKEKRRKSKGLASPITPTGSRGLP